MDFIFEIRFALKVLVFEFSKAEKQLSKANVLWPDGAAHCEVILKGVRKVNVTKVLHNASRSFWQNANPFGNTFAGSSHSKEIYFYWWANSFLCIKMGNKWGKIDLCWVVYWSHTMEQFKQSPCWIGIYNIISLSLYHHSRIQQLDKLTNYDQPIFH